MAWQVEMLADRVVCSFLSNIPTVFLHSVSESSLGFSNVEKVYTLLAHQFVDYISGVTVDGG